MAAHYWIETLGCPKNQVDSDKLVGTLHADGLQPAAAIEQADVVVVNTCAFIEDARQESIDTILDLDEHRRPGAELVVTGCLAERYGDELAQAMPEIDRVAGFGAPLVLDRRPVGSVPVTLGATRPAGGERDGPARDAAARPVMGDGPAAAVAPLPPAGFDLLELPRPPATAPWAYVKVAEGCDRACGFCAIPSFRGPQRSRSMASILAEVEALEAMEIVLVAQDLAAFGRDQGRGHRRIVSLVDEVAARVPWVRLLYLYPSDLTDELIDAVGRTGVPYFDLSLQHVSRPLLRRMRRWGDGERFRARIDDIRACLPEATFRSNFIVGYPGETEADHDQLLRFVEETRLDWCGFFAYSAEEGTHAASLGGAVPGSLVAERLGELRALQDRITAERRDALIGTTRTVLVDRPGVARSTAEAPEIDGIVEVPARLPVGSFAEVTVTAALGPDLVAADAAAVAAVAPVLDCALGANTGAR